MPTLDEQLTSVQSAIAEIEGGGQQASSEGESLTRPSLDVLYKREEYLKSQISEEARGSRFVVAET